MGWLKQHTLTCHKQVPWSSPNCLQSPSSFFLKNSTYPQLNSSVVQSYRIEEVWQLSFISSHSFSVPCHSDWQCLHWYNCISVLSFCWNAWVSLWVTPMISIKRLFSHSLSALFASFLTCCNVERLRSSPVFEFFFLFAERSLLQFVSFLSHFTISIWEEQSYSFNVLLKNLLRQISNFITCKFYKH